MNTFGFERKSGILLPISSLPARHGIGTFGRAAYEFADFLDACGQTVWQVLPLNPTSYGDSPYQSPASVAGNPYFIDLDILSQKGLLTEEECAPLVREAGPVDYGHLWNTRYDMLRLAYSRFVPDEGFSLFCEKNTAWLEDYALFLALKVHYGHAAWTTWAPEHRDCKRAREHGTEFATEGGFWKWLQYEFTSQWNALHDYVRAKGIKIVGDMPIYVAHDSMDVWRAPEQFLLDESFNPTVVAGCPPDAYSEDGQRWGNPIYNWDLMEEEGFSWWLDRIGCAFSLYDLLRIDHFRGFACYYTIPAEEETAINGTWEQAPGMSLFDAVKEAYPDGHIIAEDLGFITDDVRELLEYTEFPGMKVLQFAFYDADNEYLPRCYTTDNCIVYTATHDSNCTKSWYEGLDKATLMRFRKECRRYGKQTPTAACIDLAMGSRANLCVIAMQDYLELSDEEARMNVPSKASGNWVFRVSPDYNNAALKRRIRTVTQKANRLK